MTLGGLISQLEACGKDQQVRFDFCTAVPDLTVGRVLQHRALRGRGRLRRHHRDAARGDLMAQTCGHLTAGVCESCEELLRPKPTDRATIVAVPDSPFIKITSPSEFPIASCPAGHLFLGAANPVCPWCRIAELEATLESLELVTKDALKMLEGKHADR